jgi:hypothetical protein
VKKSFSIQKTGDDGMYSVELHKELVNNRLQELNYPQDLIDIWIAFIDE